MQIQIHGEQHKGVCIPPPGPGACIPPPGTHEMSRKRPAMDQPDMEPFAKRSSEGAIIFRVACPSDKTGPIIGKGGAVIRDIRESTGCKITIGDAPPGLQERGVVILSQDRPGENSCGAQDALDRVMTRLFQPDATPGQEPPPAEPAHLVLLIDRAYIGIIVGKGGENIKKVRETSGIQVTLKSKGQGSQLEGPDEETFILDGALPGVRVAARMITDKVRESVSSGVMASPSTMAIAHAHSGARAAPGAPGFAPAAAATASATAPPGSIRTEYRLLVPDARVGGIIGKGGERLRQLRDQSRAEVRIDRIAENHPERLIVCTSHEPAHAEYCAAAEGAMMVASRALSERRDDPAAGQPVTMRLLAGSDQMGAVLGVKGSIIRQVSMDTGARLAVLDPNAPNAMSVAGPGDSVLEMVGMQPQVLEALRIATMLLRGAMIRQQQPAPTAYAPPPPQYAQPAPAFVPGQPGEFGYSQPQQPQMQNMYAPPPAPTQYAAPAAPQDPYAAYYAAYGQQQQTAAAAPTYEQQPPAPQLGSPVQQYQQYQAPGPAPAPQFTSGAPLGGYSAPPPAPAPRGGGGGGGGGAGPPPANPAINTLYNPSISSTGLTPGLIRYTFMLPSAHVGTLLGSRGSNVSAIRTTSGARIKVQDALPGSNEREVEICGQPAQVSIAHTAAQSLISNGELPANCRT